MNPYNITFGKKPGQVISRMAQTIPIVDAFCQEEVSQQIYMITGVRGMGKTVFMTEISQLLRDKEDWIVVELNSEKDLLKGLAAKLSGENTLAGIFKEAKINLSFFGFGVEISDVAPVTDIEMALEKMLLSLKKKGKKVLVTIDEASNTEYMRIFAAAFQIFIRHDLPLFLLMTGLYDHISKIQNEKTLTFLYRAPKIVMQPLNIRSITGNYIKNFNLSEEDASNMAGMTCGYSFAFQVMGYFTWEAEGDYKSIINNYRQYLEDYVYDKLWSELSKGDRRIAHAIALSKDGKVMDVRRILEISTNDFNPYRKRLIRKGLINGDVHGYVTFVLPFFREYVLDNYTP